jgi:thiamine-monophosphate kinase
MPTGEFDLIAAIAERLPAPGPRVKLASGDDAAVVEPRASSAITVDAVVDGVHFRLDRFGARAAGRKALSAALSDLAAMGAAQGEAYVVVASPAELDDSALLEIADGLAEVATRDSVSIAGGDLVSSPVLIISITAVGYQTGSAALVSRAGAQPRDVLAVTGELGGAAAALTMLEGGEPRGALPPERREQLLARQLDPVPRLKEGRALAAAGARAMIDISDGLGADAGHIAEASECRLEIDLGLVPLADGTIEVAGGREAALELAATGGEDYELLVSLPAERADAAATAVAEAGGRLTQIGYATEGRGVSLRLPDGRELEPRGFDQRRGSLSGSGGAGSASGSPSVSS